MTDVKNATLSLTEDEWSELLACIETKQVRVAHGEYLEDEEAETWGAELLALAKKVRDQGEGQGISF